MSLGGQIEADALEALERVAPAIALDLWSLIKLVLMKPDAERAEAIRKAKYALLADAEDAATDEVLRAALHAERVAPK